MPLFSIFFKNFGNFDTLNSIITDLIKKLFKSRCFVANLTMISNHLLVKIWIIIATKKLLLLLKISKNHVINTNLIEIYTF